MNNRGIGTLEAILAAGIVALVAAGAAIGYRQLKSTQRIVASAAKVAEIESQLTAYLKKRLRTTADCLADPQVGIDNAPLGVSTIDAVTSGIGLVPNGFATDAPSLQKAVRDCGAPSTTQFSRYFCARFGTGGADPDSFFSSDYAFAEVLIKLKNLRTDADMSCADFQQDFARHGGKAGISGALIKYTIHWSHRNVYRQKAGSIVGR